MWVDDWFCAKYGDYLEPMIEGKDEAFWSCKFVNQPLSLLRNTVRQYLTFDIKSIDVIKNMVYSTSAR